jgi:hypothetical protein
MSVPFIPGTYNLRCSYTVYLTYPDFPLWKPRPVQGTYVGPWQLGRPKDASVGSFETLDFQYRGLWQNGTMQGKGKGIWTTRGTEYEGHWADNRLHGCGVFTYADGVKFKGEWRQGTPHGQGEFTWANGNWLKGEWRDGDFYGMGFMAYHDTTRGQLQSLFKGEMKLVLSNERDTIRQVLMHGMGECHLQNGHKYRGLQKDGWYHGPGELLYPDGEKFIAEFKNGKMFDVYDRRQVTRWVGVVPLGPTSNFNFPN